MLAGLVELEGRAAIAARLAEERPALWQACPAAYDGIGYLFWGRAPAAPALWVAGAVGDGGHPATGSGRSVGAALAGIAGELAEAACRAADTAPALGGTAAACGHGAHPDPAEAARHAAQEAQERLCIGQWWQGARGATLWDGPGLDRALTAAGTPRGPRRPVLALCLSAAAERAEEVVLLASFDRDGGRFAFGAACRDTRQQALAAAARELAQAEFGLTLAEAKAAGGQALARSETGALRLAAEVTPGGLRAMAQDRPPAPPAAAPPAAAAAVLRPLGLFAGHLHVAEATIPAGPAAPLPVHAAPYAHLALY